MSNLASVSIGSGTLTHIGPLCPAISGQFPDGRYPVEHSQKNLKHRDGTAMVLLNVEDLSIHIGLRQQAITVVTSAVPLPSTPLEFRRNISIANKGPSTVYIGGSNVTTLNGFPLDSGQKMGIDNQNIVIYGISDGSSDVRIIEFA